MEEYLQKLIMANETNFDEPDDRVVNEHRPSHKVLKKACLGKGIIANKDFMQVMFITCFLPFIHPNLPQLKETEVKFAKKN